MSDELKDGTVTMEDASTEKREKVQVVEEHLEGEVVEGSLEREEKEEHPEGEEPPRKVDAETRVREALEAAKEATSRAAMLQKEFDELKARQTEVKPYQELTLEEVETVVSAAEEEIERLKADGRKFEAKLAQRRLDKYLDFVEENEQKRKEFEDKKTATQTEQVSKETWAKNYVDAAEFYRSKKGYPKELFDQVGEAMGQEFEKNPIEGRKFVELIQKQGFMAAFEYADKYYHDTVVPKFEREKMEREKAKKAGVSGAGAGKPATEEKPLGELPVADYFKKREEDLRKQRR